jgi:hypothetical protein
VPHGNLFLTKKLNMVTTKDLEAQYYEIIDNTIILWAVTGQEFYCTIEQFRSLLELIDDKDVDVVVVGGNEILEKIEDNSITIECDIRLSSKNGSSRINISNSIWDYELTMTKDGDLIKELLLLTN